MGPEEGKPGIPEADPEAGFENAKGSFRATIEALEELKSKLTSKDTGLSPEQQAGFEELEKRIQAAYVTNPEGDALSSEQQAEFDALAERIEHTHAQPL